MLAFGIKPTPFHFGLLLNITHHCGLGSPKSMNELLFPTQPDQLLLDGTSEAETKDEKTISRTFLFSHRLVHMVKKILK